MRRADLPYSMLPLCIGGSPAIGLARRGRRGAVHRLLWAVVFDEPLHREFLLAWMDRNSDRWPVWGAIAARRGAAALSARIDGEIEEEAMTGTPVMIQTYRAAAYLGCAEEDLLAYRGRDDCSELFGAGCDPSLDGREVHFVDLGGLVRRMIEDAVATSAGDGEGER